jgi:hypothetical protein
MTEFVELFAGDRAQRYDGAIRRLIPGYEAFLQLAVAELAAAQPAGAVLAAGCGTGQEAPERRGIRATRGAAVRRGAPLPRPALRAG